MEHGEQIIKIRRDTETSSSFNIGMRDIHSIDLITVRNMWIRHKGRGSARSSDIWSLGEDLLDLCWSEKPLKEHHGGPKMASDLDLHLVVCNKRTTFSSIFYFVSCIDSVTSTSCWAQLFEEWNFSQFFHFSLSTSLKRIQRWPWPHTKPL